MSDHILTAKPVFRIRVSVTRYEHSVAGHDWVKGGPEKQQGDDPDAYGYTPLINTINRQEHDLMDLEVVHLDQFELMRAILEHSEPLEPLPLEKKSDRLGE